MRLCTMFSFVFMVAACQDQAPPPPPIDERAHNERFIGLWVVEQPTHALYEATYYDFMADGTLITGSSIPGDCSGHLSRHCVTGSVANCVPDPATGWCESDLTCVFGDTWYSLDSSTLIIIGACSDDRPREILFAFSEDPSLDTEWGGAGAALVSVGSETSWTHDNWPWAFRRCPAGTDESTCPPGA